MEKKLVFYLVAILLFASCSKDKLDNQINTNSINQYSKSEINKVIESSLSETGDFRWDDADPSIVWSALVNSDNVLAVGYKPASIENTDIIIGTLNHKEGEWEEVKDELLNIILSMEKDKNKISDLELKEDKILPLFYIKTTNYDVVERLMRDEKVDFVEPLGYSMESEELRSAAGCGSNYADWSISSPDDYQEFYPKSKISWHLFEANVPAAWDYSEGDNTKVCIIDTGTSPNQSNFFGGFTQGMSGGRTITRDGTFVPSWWSWWWGGSPDGPDDLCGHGTQMSGLASSPRNWSGCASGTAFKSDLYTIRATGDVFISNSMERDGVKQALIKAGNSSSVKIVSMSIGTPFYSGTVGYGVSYAYNHGKMLFAAAGTSTSWTSWWGVIYPAKMWQCIAVTGIVHEPGYDHCSTCHYGSEVEFSLEIEKDGDDMHALSLAMSGNWPSTVGGSSAATATTAGIAALVWSYSPWLSRSQVKNRMKNASENANNPDSDYGYGRINAEAAVLGGTY